MRFLPYSNSLHRYKFKREINKIRIIEVVVALLFISIFAGIIYENISDNRVATKFKSKYKYSSVDNNKIAYGTAGTGKYTVVLDSSVGATSQEWTKLIKSPSKDIRFYYYDRFGYGLSQYPSEPLTLEEQAKALHTILKKSGLKSPYILVGNSYGSLVITNYAKNYPDDVGGIILIDPPTSEEMASEEFISDNKKELRNKKVQQFLSSFGILRIMDKLNSYKDGGELLDSLSGDNKEFLKSNRVTSKYLNAYSDELKNMTAIDKEFMNNENVKKAPLFIITKKNKLKDESKEKQRIDFLDSLSKISSDGKLEVVEEQGNIPLKQTEYLSGVISNLTKKVMRIYEK